MKAMKAPTAGKVFRWPSWAGVEEIGGGENICATTTVRAMNCGLDRLVHRHHISFVPFAYPGDVGTSY